MSEATLPAKLDDVLREKVLARLNEELSTLVPEETLTGIVKGHVDSWLKNELPSLISGLLREKCEGIIRGEISQIANDGGMVMVDENGAPTSINDEFLRTLVKDHAADLTAGLFASIIKAASQKAAYEIRSGIF